MIYLSPERQRALNYSIYSHLRRNHFGVKNMGYLFAIEHGAEYIWDTDDDNDLKSTAGLERLLQEAKRAQKFPLAGGQRHLWNPYPAFRPMRLASAQTEDISWPRGFPLEYVKDEAAQIEKSGIDYVNSSVIGVYQSLADNDPDVDGIYRLTKQIPLRFLRKAGNIALGKNQFAPFNAQATLWMQNTFWGLLLPISVHGRVTDIWRSYIAERLMSEMELYVVFTPPLVEQFRNAHSLIADLQSEIPLYTQANEHTKWLSKWTGTGTLWDKIEQLAIDLYEIGIIEEADVRLYQAWLNDLSSIGYKTPRSQSHRKVNRSIVRENPTRMPRVAVCVSGQIRTLTTPVSDPYFPRKWGSMRSDIPLGQMTVAESIRKNLYPKLGFPDVFMYVSTKESMREPKTGNASVCDPLRSQSGHLECKVPLENRLRVATIPIWNSFRFGKGRDNVAVQGLLQQLRGMFECHRAVEKYAKKNGITYDWLVRLRPDVYVHSFPSLQALARDIDGPTVWYASRKRCCCGNEDWFGVAPTKWMHEYFDRFLYLQQRDWAGNWTWTAERFLRIHLDLMGVRLRPHDGIHACVVKPTYRRSRSDA